MQKGRIAVEREGQDKIALTGWIGPETPAKCKAVGGGRFIATGPRKRWRYALDMSVCRRLREVFGPELAIGPELTAWAREQVAAEAADVELAASADAELAAVPEHAPRIADAMASRTYQRVAARWAAGKSGVLIADQPGLGKTLETLGAIIEHDPTPGLHLILCPAVAVESVWAAEVRQWLGERAMVATLLGTKPERARTLRCALGIWDPERGKHLFVVGNIEMARIKPEEDDEGKKSWPVENADYPDLFAVQWDTIVVDESHRALIRTSGNPTQQRAGMTRLCASRRIALSGTPMRGRPEQLWGTLNWLRPDVYTSYWNWVQRYFHLTSNGYSNYVLGGMMADASDRMAKDSARVMLRRTKAEVATDLPPKTYAGTHLIAGDAKSPHGVWLAMGSRHAKQYEKFEKDASLDFEDGSFMTAEGALVEYLRRRQLANAVHTMADDKLTPTGESEKLDWLRQKLVELGIAGDAEGDARIVVASQFTSLLNTFARALTAEGVGVHLLTGETSAKKRVEMIADFQSDAPRARVFMINTKAGGVAVTLDRADDLVILDETTIPDDQEQVEDRVHRVGRLHNVTIHYLRMLDTIDEEIAWVSAARESVQKYILDGARGVEHAKSLYLARQNAGE